MPKSALFPIAYDEISLVDAGGGESEDGTIGPNVLIIKRRVQPEEVLDLGIISKAPDQGIASKPNDRRRSKNAARRMRNRQRDFRKQQKRKAESDPCGDTTNSTGAKESDPSKKSKRAKNFKEERHKRDEKGRMAKTSEESKKKYGKGGTTKAKQDAECRSKGKVRKQAADFITKGGSAVSRFDIDARLRATMERKPS